MINQNNVLSAVKKAYKNKMKIEREKEDFQNEREMYLSMCEAMGMNHTEAHRYYSNFIQRRREWLDFKQFVCRFGGFCAVVFFLIWLLAVPVPA